MTAQLFRNSTTEVIMEERKQTTLKIRGAFQLCCYVLRLTLTGYYTIDLLRSSYILNLFSISIKISSDKIKSNGRELKSRPGSKFVMQTFLLYSLLLCGEEKRLFFFFFVARENLLQRAV